MAISTIQPYTRSSDLVTYKEATKLFAQTGHPVSETTIRRWVKERKLDAPTVFGIVYVSYSDLLVAHGDWVAHTVP
ncbi:hypothetical protein [Streptomyces sp. NPDC015130]|uniref:hypothetical protein n=1 Tax=Streptomyces sp. NPDC015130 TaxID=3364940 RepID=UPI0036F929B0